MMTLFSQWAAVISARRRAGVRSALREGGELNLVSIRDVFQRTSGGLPGVEASPNDTGVKSFFSQQVRHTGAGGLVHSSAVEVDPAALGQKRGRVRQAVGLQAQTAEDALRPIFVVAVAADVVDRSVDLGEIDFRD